MPVQCAVIISLILLTKFQFWPASLVEDVPAVWACWGQDRPFEVNPMPGLWGWIWGRAQDPAGGRLFGGQPIVMRIRMPWLFLLGFFTIWRCEAAATLETLLDRTIWILSLLLAWKGLPCIAWRIAPERVRASLWQYRMLSIKYTNAISVWLCLHMIVSATSTISSMTPRHAGLNLALIRLFRMLTSMALGMRTPNFWCAAMRSSSPERPSPEKITTCR